MPHRVPRRRRLGLRHLRPRHETYTDAVLRTGDYAGDPTAAFDTAVITHLAEYQQ
jgi:hypothetical protein